VTDREQRRAIAEALIFAAEEPVSLAELGEILEVAPEEAEATVNDIRAAYQQPGRGLRLSEVAGGLRFTTRPDYHPWVKILFRNQRTVRLTRAALQTLAIIAYKQPVTGPEIEEIRGVDAAGLLKNLLDKRLITILGRKDVVGRPILYGTTKEFLLQFGLKGLDDLPNLEEFEELLKADMGGAEAAEVADTVEALDERAAAPPAAGAPPPREEPSE
jgi:segregation and condensation protein B